MLSQRFDEVKIKLLNYILRFYLGDLNESLVDLERAIDKSEENVAKYYYVIYLNFLILYLNNYLGQRFSLFLC